MDQYKELLLKEQCKKEAIENELKSIEEDKISVNKAISKALAEKKINQKSVNDINHILDVLKNYKTVSKKYKIRSLKVGLIFEILLIALFTFGLFLLEFEFNSLGFLCHVIMSLVASVSIITGVVATYFVNLGNARNIYKKYKGKESVLIKDKEKKIERKNELDKNIERLNSILETLDEKEKPLKKYFSEVILNIENLENERNNAINMLTNNTYFETQLNSLYNESVKKGLILERKREKKEGI